MRRVILAFLGTLVGTTALVGLKNHQGTDTVAAADAGPSGGAPPGGALGAVDGAGAAPNGSAPASAQATPRASSSGRAAPGPTTAPPSGSAPPASSSRTVSGFTCKTRYGSVRVAVTVTGSHIDDVSYRDTTTQPRSSPSKLRSQVLSAQSGKGLTVVSGATYTSAAFIASVQNALYGNGLDPTVWPFKGHVTSCG
jgi:uncharacterized protein with FMN-binding domain